jgi:hypothetical protein
MVGLSFYM